MAASKGAATPAKARVLCVDDDRDIAEVVQAILNDEGYAVSCLYDVADDALRRTVGQLEPDCVLLDSEPGSALTTWTNAAWLDRRARHVPTVLFTAHHPDAEEAREADSKRSREAGFVAIVEKPFHIDDLLAAVAKAVGESEPFDRSKRAETARTDAFVKQLSAYGARDIAPSQLREWATFRDRNNVLWQIYWWQERGVYQVGRYESDGRLTMVGQLTDLPAAIALAFPG